MASVTGFTAARMEAIEAASVVDGTIDGDDLILTRFDGSEINAGNVRGPTGSPGITEEEFGDHLGVGSIIEYIGTAAPSSKWLLMTGQTVTDAQTLYPDWWAVIPASMKSGANAIMPDTRGRVSVGLNTGDTDFNVIGKTGGAKTHTLLSTEMPAHTHIQNSHNHTQNAHSTPLTNPAHLHVDPTHIHLMGALNGHSVITLGSGGDFDTFMGSGPIAVTSRGVTSTHAAATGLNAATTAVSASDVTATNQDATATNQNAGGGAAHNNLQPYVVFLKIVKVL